VPNRSAPPEGINHNRVKLSSRAAIKLTDDCIIIECYPVWAVCHHGISSVGNHNNPGTDWNLLTSQTVRIPAAVIVLVVRAHTSFDVSPKPRNRANELRAPDRVRPNQLHLNARKTGFLSQDWRELLIDLADVMKQGRSFNLLKFSCWQTERARNCLCIPGYS